MQKDVFHDFFLLPIYQMSQSGWCGWPILKILDIWSKVSSAWFPSIFMSENHITVIAVTCVMRRCLSTHGPPYQMCDRESLLLKLLCPVIPLGIEHSSPYIITQLFITGSKIFYWLIRDGAVLRNIYHNTDPIINVE